MRIVFMGTPDFAVPSLDALVAAGHDIVAVYTQPPRPAGRGKSLQVSPVQQRATALGIEVRAPSGLRDPGAQADFAALGTDLAVVAAYGLLLPAWVLALPRLGCINIHASLLPRWRGAAPIQRAILAGDRLTGITLMQMEAGLDTGPMLAKVETPVAEKNAGALTGELAALGAALLVQVLADRAAYPAVAQPAQGVTLAPKIDKSESRLDFLISAPQAARQVHAFAPAPGAFFELKGERIRILDAVAELGNMPARPGTILDGRMAIACNPGVLVPLLVQRAGRSAMAPAELLRGFAMPPGTMV